LILAVWATLVPLVAFSAGPSSNSSQSATGNGNPAGQQSGTGGGGGGTLLAESKSTIYGALTEGMDEIAAELQSQVSNVAFNLPISIQDVANVAILSQGLKSLITSAT
jgi:hypothetical protein